jgi:hypothetical protein
MLGGARRDHGSLPSACTSAAGCCWLLHTVIDEYLFRMLPSIPPAPHSVKEISQYLGTKYLKKRMKGFFSPHPRKGGRED